jgi:hypothetical protein
MVSWCLGLIEQLIFQKLHALRCLVAESLAAHGGFRHLRYGQGRISWKNRVQDRVKPHGSFVAPDGFDLRQSYSLVVSSHQSPGSLVLGPVTKGSGVSIVIFVTRGSMAVSVQGREITAVRCFQSHGTDPAVSCAALKAQHHSRL